MYLTPVSYLGDVLIQFKINKGEKPLNVHVHIMDENGNKNNIDLPFKIVDDDVIAVLPAKTTLISNPEIIKEIELYGKNNYSKTSIGQK